MYNLAIMTDSYKATHWLQFPPNTDYLYYYFESRSDNKNLVFFGLQAILLEYFKVPTLKQVIKAKSFWKAHFGRDLFNYPGWRKISKLGYLPIEIKAIPEGTVIQSKNVLYTIVNTDPEFYWLPGWLETLLVQVWYPITVATTSYNIKQIIRKYLELTGDISELPFKLHDFGYRGASSYLSAKLGGMAHLVNFQGTDTVAAIEGVLDYYNPYNKIEMPAFSIPAAEHSTVTAWGMKFEKEAYENMLCQFAEPGTIVAVVSDSYDLDNAVKNLWGKELKNKVVNSGATVVIRPDSGDPKTMVIKTLYQLSESYGISINEKGFKVLNNVKVIQGDGISSPEVIESILEEMLKHGFSANNIAFGMGGGLLQKCDRDTYKFAQKLSARYGKDLKSGEYKWFDVFKKPKGCEWKASKAGRFSVIKTQQGYKTIKLNNTEKDYLETVYKNGDIKLQSFDEIRKRTDEF